MREMGSAPLALHITLQHAPGGPHFPHPRVPAPEESVLQGNWLF